MSRLVSATPLQIVKCQLPVVVCLYLFASYKTSTTVVFWFERHYLLKEIWVSGGCDPGTVRSTSSFSRMTATCFKPACIAIEFTLMFLLHRFGGFMRSWAAVKTLRPTAPQFFLLHRTSFSASHRSICPYTCGPIVWCHKQTPGVTKLEAHEKVNPCFCVTARRHHGVGGGGSHRHHC